MTDMTNEVDSALAALSGPARVIDRALLGDVRDGLEQLPDEVGAPQARPGHHPTV